MRGLAIVAFLIWLPRLSAHAEAHMGNAILSAKNATLQLTSASSTIITTVAGRSNYYGNEINADGIIATARDLSNPSGLATDVLGNFYISDSYHHKILKVSLSTGLITTVAGTGFQNFSGDGGKAIFATLSYPEGLAVDKFGNIFIADRGNYRIRKVLASTGIITTIAGWDYQGYKSDNVPAKNAPLYGPSDVAVDANGNIFIADTGNNRIRKVTADTGIITTVAGDGTFSYCIPCPISDGKALYVSVRSPEGVALDTSGNIFIAEFYNSRIRKVTASTGFITTVAGTNLIGYSGDGYAATNAKLNHPKKLCLDAAGNIYFVDHYNFRIRKITVSTGIITTVAGNGSYFNRIYSFSSYGDGGSATATPLRFPSAVAIDYLGNIYLTDNGKVVRKVTFNTPSTSSTPVTQSSATAHSAVARHSSFVFLIFFLTLTFYLC